MGHPSKPAVPTSCRPFQPLRLVLLGLGLGWGLAAQAAPPALPATYIGEMPCANCVGVDWQLDLEADHSFQLSQAYRGKGVTAAVRRNGRWSLDAKGDVLTLEAPGSDSTRLSVQNPERLRLLDGESRSIASRHNYELVRLPQALPARVSGTLTGLYSRQGKEGSIRLCAPGSPQFPVAAEAAYGVLESAAGKLGREVGEAQLVRFAGHLASRRDGQVKVVVDRFYGVWPQAGCPGSDAVAAARPAASPAMAKAVAGGTASPAAASAPLPLVGTTWRLVQLDGKPLSRHRGNLAPHLLLQADGRVSGAGGCNRILGSYELKGQRIGFSQMGGSLMACMHHMDEEQAFLNALGWAQSWQISDRHLLLRDGDGKAIAVFQAGSVGK